MIVESIEGEKRVEGDDEEERVGEGVVWREVSGYERGNG